MSLYTRMLEPERGPIFDQNTGQLAPRWRVWWWLTALLRYHLRERQGWGRHEH